MNGFFDLLLLAVYWCTARNLVFRGFGAAAALEIASSPRRILILTAFHAAFALPAAAISHGVAGLIEPQLSPELGRLPSALCFVAVSAALYAGAMLLLAKKRPERGRRLRPELTCSAFSVLTMGAFLLAREQAMPLHEELVLMAACCAAFLIASFLLLPAGRLSRSPRIPGAFRGLPAQLLYAAIVTLPLAALASIAG